MVASDGKVSAVIMAHFARFCKLGHSMVWGYGRCRIPFFSITAHFSASGSAWRQHRCARSRTAGGRHADRSACRVHPRQGSRSRVLCSALAAHPAPGGSSSFASRRRERAHQKELQVEYFLRTGKRCVPPAACPRLGTAVQDLRSVYTQELALAQRLDAAADTAPSPLRETLTAMAQQDRCHAQTVRNLLACLLG